MTKARSACISDTCKEKHFFTLMMTPLLTQKGQTVLMDDMLNHGIASAALQTNKEKNKKQKVAYEATPTNCPVHT